MGCTYTTEREYLLVNEVTRPVYLFCTDVHLRFSDHEGMDGVVHIIGLTYHHLNIPVSVL